MRSLVSVFLLLVLVLAASACGDSDAITSPSRTYTIQKISGDGQIGAPGQALPEPYVVRVVDESGGIVPGVDVGFRILPGDGGSLSASRVTTDSAGNASVIATLPTTVGASQTVEAGISSTVTPIVFISFTGLEATDASDIRIVSGDLQKGITKDTLLDPLVVEVTNLDGVVVPGATVKWEVISNNGGSVRETPTTTDALGLTQNRVRAGDVPGAVDRIIAWIETAGDLADTVTFTADITGVPDTIVIVQGAVDFDHDYTTPEVVIGDTSFVAYGHWARQPFKGVVYDAAGRTVRGATLTWTVTNWWGKVGDEPDGPGTETVMVNTAEDGAITVWRRACHPEVDLDCPPIGEWISATLSLEDYPEVVPITLMAMIRP
jgi:hypothetical protein